MKKSIFILFLLSMVVCSCQKLELEEDVSLDPKVDYERNFIESLGFDKNAIEDKGTFYLVEGDVIIHKEDINNIVQTKQYWCLQVKEPYQRNIKVTLGTERIVIINWAQAVARAVQEWSNISGCNISMTFNQNSTTPGDIHISFISGGASNNLGTADFPTMSGAPGANIYINQSYNSYARLSESQKIFLVIHELGHCLGFRHTDWYDNGEPQFGPPGGPATHIPGTPNAIQGDKNSVMNGINAAGRKWEGFTNYDKIAAKWLYPAQ